MLTSTPKAPPAIKSEAKPMTKALILLVTFIRLSLKIHVLYFNVLPDQLAIRG